MNFVYKELGSASFVFYIYTPANLGGFGLVLQNEEVYFKASPAHTMTCIILHLLSSPLLYLSTQPTPDWKSVEELTLFQIEPKDEEMTNIKAVNTEIGLYVDRDDGWKVKATTDEQRWSKFWITGFTPQI